MTGITVATVDSKPGVTTASMGRSVRPKPSTAITWRDWSGPTSKRSCATLATCLERLRDRLSLKDEERQRQEKELKSLKERLEQKTTERDRMLGLFRRGRIDDATLDQHLNLINTEAARLQAGIEAAERALSAEDRAAQLRSAESLLATLRAKLAGPISPELKRRIVEILVEKVQADTVERFGVQQSEITIVYRFSRPEEPAALVLPRSHRISNRNRSAGDAGHDWRPSFAPAPDVEVAARQVAERLGVDKMTVSELGEQQVQTRPRVHASRHPFPRVQPASCAQGVGQSAGAGPDHPGSHAEGSRAPDRGGREHAGALGTRRAGTLRRLRGIGYALPGRYGRKVIFKGRSHGLARRRREATNKAFNTCWVWQKLTRSGQRLCALIEARDLPWNAHDSLRDPTVCSYFPNRSQRKACVKASIDPWTCRVSLEDDVESHTQFVNKIPTWKREP